MGEPLKSLSPRARLGAALPAHYPGTPPNFEDVSDESTLSLNDVLATISTEDATLANQIRRFRGPWLLSRADDHDHKILTASKTFVADMKYKQGELVGHNCKKLQGPKKCAVNDACNKQLSAAFRANEDVHVVLRNYDGAGEAFGNSLTVLVLRDANENAVYRLGVIKTVVAPPEESAGLPSKSKKSKSKKPAAKKPSARKKR